MAATPSTLSAAEKDAVAQQIAPQMKELEAALADATAMINSQSKRSLPLAIEARSCSDSCLTGKASGLVAEISGTLKGVIGTLGISKS